MGFIAGTAIGIGHSHVFPDMDVSSVIPPLTTLILLEGSVTDFIQMENLEFILQET